MQKGASGYSVIELMVAVGIVAVLASIGVPSYTEFIEKRRITGAADEIVAVMALARGSAVKHNQPTTVSFNMGESDWCMGVVLGSVGCDCMVSTESAENYCAMKYSDVSGNDVVESQIISNDEYSDVAMIAATTGSGDSRLSFDPVRGVLADLSDIASFTIRSTTNAAYELRIDISATGTVKTCTNGVAMTGMKSC